MQRIGILATMRYVKWSFTLHYVIVTGSVGWYFDLSPFNNVYFAVRRACHAELYGATYYEVLNDLGWISFYDAVSDSP